jgi:hypothetical protein
MDLPTILKSATKMMEAYTECKNNFDSDIQKPFLCMDFKQVCDKYQNSLYIFYFELSQIRKSLLEGEQQMQEINSELSILINEIGVIHMMIKDNRQLLYDQRNSFLVDQGFYLEKEKKYCHCTSRYFQPQFLEDGVDIEKCGICYLENVVGIRPECCKENQEICLSCLKTQLVFSYKSCNMTGILPLQNDRILSIHHQCAFCRSISCFYKYKYILPN